MDQFQNGGSGNPLCLSSSCMTCKKHNQRKVVMCKRKDCKLFPTKFSIRDKVTGVETPYIPEDPAALVANFPRRTLRTRGY
jgi:hypothetical protein